MDDVVYRMHLVAGREYGRAATCGSKVDYKSEDRAAESAVRMSARFGRALKEYPCFWCMGWHIGRAMTLEERERFAT